MEIGLSLPTVGPVAFREFVLDVARTAEEAGLHSVWTADHIALPKDRASPYPYPQSEKGIGFSYEPGVDWLDPIAVMGFVAGATERIAIGTSVLVLPYRNPLVLANEVATLDRLSEGRILLGVGAGWIAEEFAALGIPARERGPRTDEAIRVLRHVWSHDEPTSFEGRFFRFADVQLATRPFTPGGPPIYVGGNSEAALRRVATLGDGWLGFDIEPDEVATGVARIRSMAEEAGRDPGAIAISARRGLVPEGAADLLPARPALRGSSEDIVEALLAFREAGVTLMAIDLVLTMDELLPAIEWLARDVGPRVA